MNVFLYYYRRMSEVDDDPEDVVNSVQASVWGGEFSGSRSPQFYFI